VSAPLNGSRQGKGWCQPDEQDRVGGVGDPAGGAVCEGDGGRIIFSLQLFEGCFGLFGKVQAMLPENGLSKLSRKELLQKAKARKESPTYAEKRLLKLLVGRRLFGLRFRFQYVYKSDIFDFYCPEIKLVIEVDYSVEASHQVYYQARDSRLQAESIYVLRTKNDLIMDHFGRVADSIQDKVYEILQSKWKAKHKYQKQDPIPVPSL
jgi:very-short-patch-repair endonuclease